MQVTENVNVKLYKQKGEKEMTNLKIFNNEEFGKVRVTIINDEPWFVGKDVAEILGYSNTQKAIRDHVDEDDKLTERFVQSGQNREMYIINESGLYSLILSSKLPKAKKFKRWVTNEILPEIRKTGIYKLKEGEPLTEKQMEQIKIGKAQILERLAIRYRGSQYEQILHAYITKELTGEFLIPLRKIEIEEYSKVQSNEKFYTATEVANIVGTNALRIGALAKENDMKIPAYGAWFKEKSSIGSTRVIDRFKYNERAIRKFKAILDEERKLDYELTHLWANNK